jgi:hypothetical protein
MKVKPEHTLLGVLVVTSVALLIDASLGFFIGIIVGCTIELVRYKLSNNE